MSGVIRLLCVSCALLIVALAPAQIADGLDVSVTVTTTVAGLRYNASATPSKQQATSAVSCTATGGPQGWNYVYFWFGEGVTFDDPESPSTTVRANGPGKYTIGCYVECQLPGYEWVYVFGEQSKPFVAIGGPMQLGVTQGEPGTGTPSHEVNADGQSEITLGSWYVQYFGYDRSAGPVPADTQASQMGTVHAYDGQPNGVTYSWSVPSPLKQFEAVPATQNNIKVCATNGSAGGRIKIVLTYNYADPSDPTITGSTTDDSDETPPPGETDAKPNWYRFVVAKPDDVTDVHANRITVVPGGGFTTYGVSDAYRCTLMDDGDNRMPGVWLAERFSNIYVASGLTAPTPTFWTTKAVGTHTEYDNNSSPPAAIVHYGGDFVDFLFVQYVQAVVPPANPIVQITQKYYAASKQTSPNATSGMLVATYTIKMWTNQTTHTK